jgi:hypothetical protein
MHFGLNLDTLECCKAFGNSLTNSSFSLQIPMNEYDSRDPVP